MFVAHRGLMIAMRKKAPTGALGLDVVGGGGRVAAASRPVGVEKLAARFIGTLIGVGAEIIPLRLQQIGG